MLPKIDVPVYETTLISTGKKVKFRPFLVKEQKLFLMASQSDDAKEVESVRTIEVALELIVPFNVVVAEPPTYPPQVPAPQPLVGVETALPALTWYTA